MPTAQSQKPIGQYILPFLDYCEVEKGLSDNTQKNYSQYLGLFSRWLSLTNRKNLLPQQLSQQDIWDYRLYLARTYKTLHHTHLSKKSQNYYLIAIRVLLEYFTERDIVSIPSSKVKLAKEHSENQVSFLELHDIEKLLTVPDTASLSGLRDRAILEMFFSTGMRISELVALNKNDVSSILANSADQSIELSIIGKGRRVRTVYISPRAAGWLKKYLHARANEMSPALFINVRSKNSEERRLSPRSIQMMLSRFSKRAGISKKVTPHTLRHSYATDLLSRGADLRSVQEFLGHKSVATTQVYTHLTNKRLRDIHEKFHGGSDMSNK